MDEPYRIPDEYPRGRYLLVFDPLDGWGSNSDVNVSVGTIFSICSGQPPAMPKPANYPQAWPRAGCRRLRHYEPAELLVLTVGAVASRLTARTAGFA